MRLRATIASDNPVAQVVARAVHARDPVTTREAFAPLEVMNAETLLPGVVELLQVEAKRPRRQALLVGGISVGIPLLLTPILLVSGVSLDIIWGILLGLINIIGAGIFVAALLWWQVTGRWLLTRQAAVRIAARLVDPAALEDLIELIWLSRRRRDTKSSQILEAALVRLLSRFDPEQHQLSRSGRKCLLALTERGDADLQVATLLTLASLKEPLVIPLALQIQKNNSAPERVQIAARECLETLRQ